MARDAPAGAVVRRTALATARSGSPLGALGGVLVGILSGACGEHRPEVRVLDLLGFQQEGLQAVFLDEPLVFDFDLEIDRASLTPGSLAVTDEGGRAVRGELVVEPTRVRFLPRLPRQSDLSDGSFRPGQRYTVHLAGFPRPDGLRGIGGEPLRRSYRSSFHTVVPEGGGHTTLFKPTGSSRIPQLRPQSLALGATDPILLNCDSALDPSTLKTGDFELRRLVDRSSGGAALEPVPLRARLVENQREGATIELRAVDAEEVPQVLVPGEYHLFADRAGLSLRDLGGRGVSPSWGASLSLPLVVASRSEGRLRREDFLDSSTGSPEAVPGTDGLAWWSGRGYVTARFPAAAGDGEDGELVLRKDLHEREIRATRLILPGPGEGGPGPLNIEASGLVILAAQHSLHIDGTLRRHVEPEENRRRPDESVQQWAVRGREDIDWRTPSMLDGFERGELLGAWLARWSAEQPDWTVLVTPGDLVIDGLLQTDGPLLLVAGGWIRVGGRVEAREVWTLGNGGGRIQPFAQPAPLRFDEPGLNPLRSELRLGVLSHPISPPRGVQRWHPAVVSGRHGAGRYSVSFLGERGIEGGGYEEVEVRDPSLLEGCSTLRLRIELLIPPSDTWDPPLVDQVELSWDEPGELAGGPPR